MSNAQREAQEPSGRSHWGGEGMSGELFMTSASEIL